MCVGCKGLEGSDAIRAAFASVRAQRFTPCGLFGQQQGNGVRVGLFGELLGTPIAPRGSRRKVSPQSSSISLSLTRPPPYWWTSREVGAMCFACGPSLDDGPPVTPSVKRQRPDTELHVKPPPLPDPILHSAASSVAPVPASTLDGEQVAAIATATATARPREMDPHDYWDYI